MIVLGDLNCNYTFCWQNETILQWNVNSLRDCWGGKNLLSLYISLQELLRILRHFWTLLLSAPHNIKEFGVLSLSLSDHEFVYCIRKLNWMKAAPEVTSFRNYAKYDHSKFCDDLRNVDWHANEYSHNTNINNVCGLGLRRYSLRSLIVMPHLYR